MFRARIDHLRPEPEGTPSFAASLHQAFLERSALEGAGDASDVALGAFLTMRAVDQFGHPDRNADAFQHQVGSTITYLQDLDPVSLEGRHLLDIVAALQTEPPVDVLWQPLGAFAIWLEGQLRLAEALDVVETSLRVADGHGADAVWIPAQLQRARILRETSEFGEANRAYARAGDRALQSGDQHSHLLSRIGRGIVLRQLGNLPAAAGTFREIFDAAVAAGDRDAQARALHDLAATSVLQGRYETGVTHCYQAFQLYEELEGKRRALSDLGLALEQMGHYQSARTAFRLVLASQPTEGTRAMTLLELLNLAGLTRDRLSFERTRRELERMIERMPPMTRVDYELNLGLGLNAFGRFDEGEAALRLALNFAEQYRLNEYVFRIEAALEELETGAHRECVVPAADGWEEAYPGVREVVDRLEALMAESTV